MRDMFGARPQEVLSEAAGQLCSGQETSPRAGENRNQTGKSSHLQENTGDNISWPPLSSDLSSDKA